MAVAYKSAGAGAGTESNGAQLALACPATVDAGDILIAHIVKLDTSTSPTDPSGWTQLAGPYDLGTTTAQGRHWVYGRIADGSEDGTTINFGTTGGTAGRYGRIYSFSGRTSGTIQQLARGFSATTHDTDPQMPTVVAQRAGALAVALVAQDDNNAIASATGESGGDWTEAVGEFTSTTLGAQGCMCQLQTADMAAPGTISGGSASTTDDECGVIGFELKPDPVLQGAVVTPITVTPVVSGVILRRGRVSYAMFETPESGAVTGAVAFPITFTAVTAARVTALSRVDDPVTVNRVVTGRVTARSASATAVTFGTVTAGYKTTRSAVALPITADVTAAGVIMVNGSASLAVTLERVTAARVTMVGQVALPVSWNAVTTSGPVTVRSAVSLAETFGVVTTARRTTYGAVVQPETLEVVTDPLVGARSAVVFPITVSIVTTGRGAGGAVVLPITFGITANGEITFTNNRQGRVSYAMFETPEEAAITGAVAFPINWNVTTTAASGNVTGAASLAVQYIARTGDPRVAAAGLVYLHGDADPQSGLLTARSAVALPITVGIQTAGQVSSEVVTGASSSSWTLNVATDGKRTTRSAVALPVAFGVTTAARVTARSRVAFPVAWNVTVASRATVRAAVSLPITFGITTTAAGGVPGSTDMPVTWAATTSGFATHYAATSLAATLSVTTAATATVRTSSTFAITAGISTSGLRTRFGRVDLPVLFNIETRGVGAGMVAGRTSLELTATVTTDPQLFALGRVALPIGVTVSVSPRQVAYSSVSLPITFRIKSGNPIYQPGSIGHISFGRWGVTRRTGTGRVRKGRAGSLV